MPAVSVNRLAHRHPDGELNASFHGLWSRGSLASWVKMTGASAMCPYTTVQIVGRDTDVSCELLLLDFKLRSKPKAAVKGC